MPRVAVKSQPDRGRHTSSPHWTPAEFSALLQGDHAAIPMGRRFEVLSHLFECDVCRTRLSQQCLFEVAPPPPQGDQIYDFAVRRAEKNVLALLERLNQGEQAARAELKKPLPRGGVFDYAQRAAAQAGAPPEIQLARARNLLNQGRELRQKDSRAALYRIGAAQELAALHRGTQNFASLATDLWIEAVAEEANVLRITGDLPAAEEKFQVAIAAWKSSQRDRGLHLHLNTLLASYLIDARESSDAASLLKQVVRGYLGMKQPHLAGRALSILAIQLNYFHSPEQSIDLLLQALDLLDLEFEPKLVVSVYQNLIVLYAEVGKPATAARMLATAAPLYEHWADEIDQLKRLWLEGKVLTGLGRALHAEEKLAAAERGFEAKKLPYQRALVLLDLTALFLTQKKFERAREIVEAALATFQALQIGREALAAILLLQDAVRQETATVAQVHAAVKGLARG